MKAFSMFLFVFYVAAIREEGGWQMILKSAIDEPTLSNTLN